MRKILILYGSYGGGHLSAAKAIYNYIKENYEDVLIEMLDCMEYINKYVNILSTKAYTEMAKKAPWAWGKVYKSAEKGPLSKISNNSNKLMARKLNTYLKEFEPNLIISTHPFSSNMCSYLKKKNKLQCQIATVMTDFEIHNQWLINNKYTNDFFVSNEHMKDEMINLGINKNKIFVTGIPVSERFSLNFNKADIYKEFNLNSSLKTILFFAGGEYGLGKSKTEEIFNVLVNNFSNLQVIAIAGKNAEMKAHFEEIVKKANKENLVKVLAFTNKVPELMCISDLVITKSGGLTTSESLISGLPMLIINPLPGQEVQNAEFLEKNNIGVWLKKHDNIKEVLDNFINDDKQLEVFHKNALKLAKKDSTKNICKILLG